MKIFSKKDRLREYLSESNHQALTEELVATWEGTMLWRIPQVSQHRITAQQDPSSFIESQPFYSSRKGIKLCLRAYLQGYHLGHPSHLSVYLVLMNGDFDESNMWPLQCNFSMVLLGNVWGIEIVSRSQAFYYKKVQ